MFLVLLHCCCCASNTSDAFLCFSLTVHLLDSVTAKLYFLSTVVRHRLRSDLSIFPFEHCLSHALCLKLEEFDVTTCDADTYFERLDCYFVANNIPDGAKVFTFISFAGPKTHKLLKSLVSPDKTSDETVDELKHCTCGHGQNDTGSVCTSTSQNISGSIYLS